MQPQYQPMHQPPQKKRAKWPWVLLGVGVFLLLLCGILGTVLLGAVGKEVDNQIEHGNTELTSHVTINSCKADQFGFAEIVFTVTNKGNSNQSYWIQFAVNDTSGKRLHEAHGIVNNLGPGKVADKQKTTGGEVSGKFTCVLERVN